MNLSQHFTLREAGRSNSAARLGIDNLPPEDVWPALRLVATEILEPVRAHYGVPIIFNGGLSWYRCPALNAAVGGSRTSQHMKGEAVDLELPGRVSNPDLAAWVSGNLQFDQLILECWTPGDPWSGWVHVSRKRSGNRGEILTYSGGVYTAGLPSV
jgi:hypothetical protein